MFNLNKTVSLLLLPLLYLNLAGMAAGGAWLNALNQTQVIWLGVMAVLFSCYVIPILLLPAGVLSHYMIFFNNVGDKKKERLMFVLSISYIILFLTLWSTGIFKYTLHHVHPKALAPALIWAASVSMTSLFILAVRDRENIFISMMIETAQLAVLALCLALFYGVITSFWVSFAVIGGVLALAAAVQTSREKNIH